MFVSNKFVFNTYGSRSISAARRFDCENKHFIADIDGTQFVRHGQHFTLFSILLNCCAFVPPFALRFAALGAVRKHFPEVTSTSKIVFWSQRCGELINRAAGWTFRCRGVVLRFLFLFLNPNWLLIVHGRYCRKRVVVGTHRNEPQSWHTEA